MKIHHISPEDFLTHGKVTTSIENSRLQMTTDARLWTCFKYSDLPIHSYIYLAEKYKLPFRIDINLKIDSPAVYLLIGRGHISLGTGDMDNRRMTSIVGDEHKPNVHRFDHSIPFNKDFDVSVIYGRKAMQLIINGQERYFTKNEKYIKSPLLETEFSDGFEFKIACDKLAELTVNSLTITEFEDSKPEFSELPKVESDYIPRLSSADKPILGECVRDLPGDIRDEIMSMDKLLMSFKNGMKFKRKIEGGYPTSRITYVSTKNISYKLRVSHNMMTHTISVLRAESTADFPVLRQLILEKIAEADSEFADKIFYRMNECANCGGHGGAGCIGFNVDSYKGVKKGFCNLSVQFKMISSDFADVKKLIEIINTIFIK